MRRRRLLRVKWMVIVWHAGYVVLVVWLHRHVWVETRLRRSRERLLGSRWLGWTPLLMLSLKGWFWTRIHHRSRRE
jgi:hypothetical protein